MVDSLHWCRTLARASTILDRLHLSEPENDRGYAVVTLHRPSNVDSAAALERVLRALAVIARDLPVVFPAHPRTRARIAEFGLEAYFDVLDAARGPQADGHITLLEPAGYVDFFRLMSAARLVLTDSGGIQEETTCLGIPCLTLRENTERPVTVASGTSTLVGNDVDRILTAATAALNGAPRPAQVPPLWDGHAAERIVRVLLERA
jgi:UDP-N-acetylglucosamine 2-epimerase (non-hydrolysing)